MTPRPARLSALLKTSGVEVLGAVGADPEVSGVTVDSRRVEPGDLFCALRGFEVDGESFVPDAVERGARAIVARSPRPRYLAEGIGWVQTGDPRRAAALLARECYGRPDEALTLVGITGTNGKTTVTYLVEAIGSAAGRRVGRIGTLGLACAGFERPLERTTPEAPELYRLLAEMRDRSMEVVVMEVSSHALTLSRVEGARFALAAFLNLGRDHLDFHGDEETYFAAKAALFENLEPAAYAVLPAEPPHGPRLAGLTRARTLTFGRTETAEIRLRDEHSGLEGSSAILDTPRGRLPIRTFLLGRHNLDNVAAAAACAVALELPLESIPAGALALEGVPGRMERIDRGQPFTVLVDYAHTPAALEHLLAWVRDLCERRVLIVFGCGGSRDTGKRPRMGQVAARLADRVYLTSDNPRGEDPDVIIDQIAAGVAAVGGAADRCERIADRRDAIQAAIGEAEAGDVVVVAGKGHETTQSQGGKVRRFDDREVVRQSLGNLGWGGQRVADA